MNEKYESCIGVHCINQKCCNITDNSGNYWTMIEPHPQPESLKAFAVDCVQGLHQGDGEVNQNDDIVFFRLLGILQEESDFPYFTQLSLAIITQRVLGRQILCSVVSDTCQHYFFMNY